MLTTTTYIKGWGKALFMVLLPSFCFGQLSLERQVYASWGSYAEISNGIDVSSTIGQVFVSTKSGTIGGDQIDLTEGFQQPDAMLLPRLAIAEIIGEAQCPDVHDGKISITPNGCLPPYSVELSKLGNVLKTVTVDNEFDSAVFTNLDSGLYSVIVVGATFCTDSTAYEVVLKNETCDLDYYSGITPNGDGKNDYWVIDNIEINYPNEVKIYSRWGTLVWSNSNYNNQDVVFRGESPNGGTLPTATYFYTIEVENNPDASKSGWIQLTR